MAMKEKVRSMRDFNLCFVSEQTPEEELHAALRKKWDWVVSTPKQNAFWYSIVINNLHQSNKVLKVASMDGVRNAITVGIKRSAFDRLKLLTQTSSKELVDVVRIPTRTLARREVFHPDESERILRVAVAFQRTIEVFENLAKARQWFSKPKKALGGKTPLQFVDTEIGADEVTNLLGRIEQGVFS